jgi:dolichol kinase
MKNRIIRRIIHVLTGMSIILLIIYNILNTRLLFYILLLSVILSVLSIKIKIPIVHRLVLMYKKEKEMPPGRGFLFFLIGSLLALKLFQQDIALASIAILTFADPASHLFGTLLGKFKLGKLTKNIEGTIFGIIIGTLSALFFVGFVEAFLACLIAMLAEYLEFRVANNTIDDNLVIPLVAGTVIYLLRLWI